MESQQQRSTYPSPLNSPSSYGSSSTSIHPTQGHHTHTPKGITTTTTTTTTTRSDPSSPYPTTFVQADTSSFKQVVQMLTGSSSDHTPKHIKSSSTTTTTSSNPNFTFSKSSIPPIKNHSQKKQQQPSSKLYERRNQLRNNLMINTLVSGTSGGLVTKTATITTNLSPRQYHQEMILSPSMLDFPKLVLSPVTPLMEDIFNNCNNNNNNKSSSTPSTAHSIEEEDKAIAEKGFYFHPSPRTNSSTTPKGAEPQLLPLFPVTTPHRVSGTS